MNLEQSEAEVRAEDVTIVIPCFNEATGIAEVLDSLLGSFPETEVIVVNDGSTDGTAEILSKYDGRIVRIHHAENRGYGASIKSACLRASRLWVVWYDADGQHTPQMAGDILAGLVGHDCAIGRRTSQSHHSWLRRPGKSVLYAVAQLLTGAKIPDLNSGLRAFRTTVLNRYLHLLPNGFSASTTTTLLMLERGYRVAWIPITTRARIGKSSVRQLRDGFRVIMLILHLANMFRPLRFYMPIALGFLSIGALYGVTRAIMSGQGIPTLAAVAIFLGVQSFFFGLLADQISAMRKERYEQSFQEEEFGIASSPPRGLHGRDERTLARRGRDRVS